MVKYSKTGISLGGSEGILKNPQKFVKMVKIISYLGNNEVKSISYLGNNEVKSIYYNQLYGLVISKPTQKFRKYKQITYNQGLFVLYGDWLIICL